MKKFIIILTAAAAFSCGDGNRSSERNDADATDNTEMAEPADSAGGIQGDERIGSDTLSTWDRDRDNFNSTDSLDNKK